MLCNAQNIWKWFHLKLWRIDSLVKNHTSNHSFLTINIIIVVVIITTVISLRKIFKLPHSQLTMIVKKVLIK